MLKVNKILPREGIEKILIRGTNWIGDAVLTLPAVAAIRMSYPHAHIAVLAKPWVADIYRLGSEIDEIIIYEKKYDNPVGVLRLARLLKKRKFHLTILLQNAVEAAIMAVVAGIPLRAGYNTDGRGMLLTHSVQCNSAIKKEHQIDYYLEMVKSLGLAPAGRQINLEKRIDPNTALSVLKKHGLAEKKIIAGIAPGATYGPAKRWFPQRFAAVADHLADYFGCTVVILGGKSDDTAASEVQRQAKNSLINLAGQTDLAEAVYIISQCSLFISNDSGLMHIAGALNIPTIAIFGSTNPATTRPAGSQSVIIRKEVSCSPCLQETCADDFRCMDLITVEDVISAAQKFFSRKQVAP